MDETRGGGWLVAGLRKREVGKREGKRPLARPRRRARNIKMDLKGIGWANVDGLFWLLIRAGSGLL
jgi:hypothetical protein